ncbi:hypothetical protein D3C83_127680 [compost metagenome]
MGAGAHLEVRAALRLAQVGGGARGAPAVLREEPVVPDAFLLAGVEVVGARDAELVPRGDDRFDQLVLFRNG